MIIATAGHIDHGKTALIRSLTGVDTDRLPEEKARGISIDLGFAYLPLDDGTLLGFVDVPGHERFVRNMLAGVCGIDFALLVVAADDGVMPQTREHLAILRLLGIARGVAVVTKTDVAGPARSREVVDDVRALLAGTPLAAAPVREVSAVTGAGIAQLRADLERAAHAIGSRWREGQHFRFAIDRVFSVAGSGTVVTGTVFNGSVAAGTRCVLAPAGTAVRIRGIEVRGVPAERVDAGARCALNLAGVEVADVARGHWLVDAGRHAPTTKLDVDVALLDTEGHPLPHQAPVHLHLGTADVLARVATPRGVALAPGASARAQLVLAQPVVAFNGDRFILRDPSARRTLGGGVVLDPAPAAGRRAAAQRPAVHNGLATLDPAAALAALLALPGYAVGVAWFARAFDLTDAHAATLLRDADAVTLGRDAPLALSAPAARAIAAAVLAALDAYHRAHPTTPGFAIDVLRRAVAPQLSAAAFQDLVAGPGLAGQVEQTHSMVQLAGRSGFTAADEVLWQRALPRLVEAGAAPLTVERLAADLGVREAVLADLFQRKRKLKLLFALDARRAFPRETLVRLAASAAALATRCDDGVFTAAQYRDAVGTGRNIAIEILELLDAIGVTRRTGDARRMNAGAAAFIGDAVPLARSR